ncbi:DICT sensory domain-containing protein [Halobacterium bonnevillei]|uniref:Histidine kinase n=1 Tax=Halobacterium bonnevillei TaxID=2692200 RepID=A0A6B0SNN2_9EURY|nr:DICT sensory domain-containing protein [Halobacterium bonnevillei]MXR22096.1 histidine kinase [Halobacterium bonnevillei]
MSLGDVIDAARRRRKTLVVHAPDSDPDVSSVTDRFDGRNVDVVVEDVRADEPEPYVEVLENGQFRAVVSLADLRSFLEPPIEDPGTYPRAHNALHELLDDSVFATLSRRQLLATSREIEDRAYRTGSGELHAGFQSQAAFEPQRALYNRLANDTDLGVHVHLVPDPGGVPDTGATVHENPHPDVGRYWFLAYDGGQTGQQCALVAEQRGSDAYHGVWTYDRELVATALSAIDDLSGYRPA